jgi:hypothetical protein
LANILRRKKFFILESDREENYGMMDPTHEFLLHLVKFQFLFGFSLFFGINLSNSEKSEDKKNLINLFRETIFCATIKQNFQFQYFNALEAAKYVQLLFIIYCYIFIISKQTFVPFTSRLPLCCGASQLKQHMKRFSVLFNNNLTGAR